MWLELTQASREPGVIMGRSSCSSSGSEVVMMDHRVMEAATHSQPAVTNLNVTRSSRVHIGPKFVSVTQNVDNTSVVKGRILGLELVAPQNSKRLRCSIAVFVCWAIVAASALIFFIFYFALAKSPTRLDIDLNETWYLRRADWQALSDYGKTLLELPVPHVIIGHSATESCNERYECIKKVLAIQRDHLDREWFDIGPNYLVGGDGFVFEGRGANLVGAMIPSWNFNSISIMFLGNYIHHEPNQKQFDHVNILLKELLRSGVLSPNYILYGQCQVIGGVITPGPHILDNLNNFEHWNPVNKTECLRE